MQVVDTLAGLRSRVKSWRQDNQTIAFVPTMGNLHEGHLSLVRKASAHADKVIVSIFVNPIQFNDKTDLDKYPRTLNNDIRLLSELACDLVFTPTETMMYPDGSAQLTRVQVPGTESKLCGLGRPGHFDGVATVVVKLFNMVQADIAVFGEKDYQQLMMIKKLVADLNIPVEILSGETCRESNGLAMSSRNGLLTAVQKKLAPMLYQTLSEAKALLESGGKDFSQITKQAQEKLQANGFEYEYFDIRRANDLELPVAETDKQLRILVAAKLGNIRLIDNIPCDLA